MDHTYAREMHLDSTYCEDSTSDAATSYSNVYGNQSPTLQCQDMSQPGSSYMPERPPPARDVVTNNRSKENIITQFLSLILAAPASDPSSPAIKTEPCEDPLYNESIDGTVKGIKSEAQSLLYADHVIKKEMAIAPTEICRSVPDAATSSSNVYGNQSPTLICQDMSQPGSNYMPERPPPARDVVTINRSKENIITPFLSLILAPLASDATSPVCDEFIDAAVEGIKSEEEAQSLLYPDHEIKEEMVIGPTAIRRPVPGLVLEEQEWAGMALAAVGSEDEGSPLLRCRLEMNAANDKVWLTAALRQRKQLTDSTPSSHAHSFHQSPFHSESTHFKEDPPRHHLQACPTPPCAKPFSCNECGKEFTQKSHLRKHASLHTGQKTHSCDICDKKFRLKQSLTRHLQYIHSSSQFSCHWCGKGFSCKKSLVTHLSFYCNKSFASDQRNQQSSVQHQSTQSANWSYSCHLCDKQFIRKRHLNEHLSIHGDRPFGCDQCDKWFMHKSDLVKHMRTHSGDRPFGCDQCDKRFNRNDNLVSPHMRTHTGDRPFACNQCDKRFTRKYRLVRHVWAHTGDSTSDPTSPVCDEFIDAAVEGIKSEEEAQSLLYPDHEIKDEMVIGPTAIRRPVPGLMLEEQAWARMALAAVGSEDECSPLLRCRVEVRDAANDKVWRTAALRQRNQLTDSIPSSHAHSLHQSPFHSESTHFKGEPPRLHTQASPTPPYAKPFSCNECGKEFTQKSQLRKHASLHIGQKTHSCDICDKKFRLKQSLTRHLQYCDQRNQRFRVQHQSTQSGNRSYSCHLCDKQFIRKRHLNEHLSIHGDRRFVCDQCDKRFIHKCDLVKHMRTHSGDRPFGCDQCDKRFTGKHNLVTHMRIHSGERPFACDLCHKQYTRKSHLVQHVNTHTGDKPFACDQCDKRFTQKVGLGTHMRTHTGERPFACDQCDKRFILGRTLTVHLKIHSGERPFACDHCHKQFIRKSDLVSHFYTHTGDRPFACNQCDKRFTGKYNLVTHMRIHSGERPFACDLCHKQFTQKSRLVRHVNTHTGHKPFVCDQCDKRFTQKPGLVIHMRTHTGERPFACDQCDKRFIERKSLISHLYVHSGERPFACDKCDKRYIRRIHLTEHLRTHIIYKPFLCDRCDKRFNRRSHLTKHLRTHIEAI